MTMKYKTISFGLVVAFQLCCGGLGNRRGRCGQVGDHRISPIKLSADWAQWGGSSLRNNTPEGHNIPTEWNIGEFDYRTGAWDSVRRKER